MTDADAFFDAPPSPERVRTLVAVDRWRRAPTESNLAELIAAATELKEQSGV